MDSRNRKIIVLAIVLLIAGAMVASFGRSLFALNTPEVVLPDSSAVPGDPAGSGSSWEQDQPVSVTPETAPAVVATLARPDSYYRELTVETFWEGGSSTTQVQVWADGGWTHSRQVRPSGVIRHDLTGADTLYYWYEGSARYETAPADERSSDLAQHIPTYETVTSLSPREITAAGYELRGDLPCIFVEVQPEDSRLVYQYWISVDSGLLVSAETLEDGALAYRMTAYAPVQAPCPADAQFQLPDGTQRHTVGGAGEEDA